MRSSSGLATRRGPVEVHAYDGETTEVEVTAKGEAGAEAVANTKIDHIVTEAGHRVLVEVPARSGLLRPWLKRGTSVRVAVRLPEGAAVADRNGWGRGDPPGSPGSD